MTADLPLLRPEIVDEFLTAPGDRRQPLLPNRQQRGHLGHVSEAEMTVRLKEGTFTGGNFLYLENTFSERQASF